MSSKFNFIKKFGFDAAENICPNSLALIGIYGSVATGDTYTKSFLQSDERFERVNELIKETKVSYANAYLHEELDKVRVNAAEVILWQR